MGRMALIMNMSVIDISYPKISDSSQHQHKVHPDDLIITNTYGSKTKTIT